LLLGAVYKFAYLLTYLLTYNADRRCIIFLWVWRKSRNN